MDNKSKKILSEISAGELLDKISILEIKLEKIKDTKYKKEIDKDLQQLLKVKNENLKLDEKIDDLFNEVKKVNLVLWNIEDEIRACEKNKDFGKKFIELARNVYLNNDKRAKIKSLINEVFGSDIREIKQYSDY